MADRSGAPPGDTNVVSDCEPNLPWIKEKYEALVDGAVHAIGRARNVFLAINVASIFILSAQYNALVPWLRHYVDKPTLQELPASTQHCEQASQYIETECLDPTQSVASREQDNECRNRLAVLQQCNAIAQFKKSADDPNAAATGLHEQFGALIWRDLFLVSVPALGLKFSVFDLSSVGSIALLVLALWFFFALRRENHSIRDIVDELKQDGQDGKSLNVNLVRYVYHGVAQQLVFSPITRDNLTGLQKGARQVLYFSPFWVIVVMLISDIETLIVPMWYHKDTTTPMAQLLDGVSWIEVTIRTVISVTFMCVCWHWLNKCSSLSHETHQSLVELKSRADNIKYSGEEGPPPIDPAIYKKRKRLGICVAMLASVPTVAALWLAAHKDPWQRSFCLSILGFYMLAFGVALVSRRSKHMAWQGWSPTHFVTEGRSLLMWVIGAAPIIVSLWLPVSGAVLALAMVGPVAILGIKKMLIPE